MTHQNAIKVVGTILTLAGAVTAAGFGTGCDNGGSGSGGSGGGGATTSGNPSTTSGGPASTGATDPTTVTSTSGGMTTTSTGGGGNGIDCPANFCTIGAYTGYGFVYSDMKDGGASTITQKGTSLCASGVAGKVVGMAYSTYWGAGIGVNLNQKAMPMSPVDPIQLTGSGVSIGLATPPATEVRVVLDDAGVAYCAVLTGPSTSLVWSDFNTTCWDKTIAGSKSMTKAPLATSIKVQVVTSADADRPFDYCIASITFN
ncbi:MAG: hypothetical protein ABJE95_08230 [Byssovorax sp.]